MWDLGAKFWASVPAAEPHEGFVSELSTVPDGRAEKTVPVENTFSQSGDSSDWEGSVQNGVREVEAVTSAWDTKSLILVFFLYVSNYRMNHMLQLIIFQHLRHLHSRLDALHNVHRIFSLCHQ